MEMRIFTLAVLCAVWSSTAAINVEIPKAAYEFARGDNVTLPCTFQSALPKIDLAVISWSADGPKTNADNVILTHYHPQGITDIKKKYDGRVAVDVKVNGASVKADLKLSSITLDDNKEFECEVQIPSDDEGKLIDATRLIVLVAPSPPICKIEGKAEYGQNINITCKSEEGSPAPTYKWQSRDVRNALRAPWPRTTDKGGILSLYNISKETSGFYVCTSSNKIRSATCNITLTVMPPSMNVGPVARIITGVVLALILFIVIIEYCCCQKKDKDNEEYTMAPYGDKEVVENGGGRSIDGKGSPRDSRVSKPVERQDDYEERSERNYDRHSDYDDHRRSDYNDRRSDYDDHRSDYDDCRSDNNDHRSDYDDHRSDYDDRRSDYDDRHSNYDDRHSKHSDRYERYDDDRRF
ncbi:PREDICTED: cell surface A33 antigen-like [Cyprinodon variegatus]|uniref:cell surface A33 antigen-like n=1 Tax=Cyprinodon variegatus TaxID=28743 RepID=UPI0007425CB1|nr:PREDICTED: cell surface A33 antigen-like [Cyprinodon variegatus]